MKVINIKPSTRVEDVKPFGLVEDIKPTSFVNDVKPGLLVRDIKPTASAYGETVVYRDPSALNQSMPTGLLLAITYPVSLGTVQHIRD